jgi:hypothetical protein
VRPTPASAPPQHSPLVELDSPLVRPLARVKLPKKLAVPVVANVAYPITEVSALDAFPPMNNARVVEPAPPARSTPTVKFPKVLAFPAELKLRLYIVVALLPKAVKYPPKNNPTGTFPAVGHSPCFAQYDC